MASVIFVIVAVANFFKFAPAFKGIDSCFIAKTYLQKKHTFFFKCVDTEPPPTEISWNNLMRLLLCMFSCFLHFQ